MNTFLVLIVVFFGLFLLPKPKKKSKNRSRIEYVERDPSRDDVKRFADGEMVKLERDLQLIEKSIERAKKEEETARKKASKLTRLYESMLYAFRNFVHSGTSAEEIAMSLAEVSKLAAGEDVPLFAESAEELKCFELKDLKALFKANEKEIKKLVEEYQERYSTKANAAVYKLMVMALDAEFRLILQKLRYGKLEKANDEIKKIIAKYYVIASEGNQTIAPTLKRFIGQLEYFYLEAAKIEHEAYVQEERAREEQRAIREQMKQEAEERKRLDAEKKEGRSRRKEIPTGNAARARPNFHRDRSKRNRQAQRAHCRAYRTA